jgi:hypothetical protein
MAQYTIANLKSDVPDQAPKFGYAPDLEARFARPALELQMGGVSYQRLAPGFRMPFGHRHGEQEEVYVVVSGGGRVKLDDEIRDVRTWDAVRVSGAVMRAFEAGPDGLELIAFGAPHVGEPDAPSATDAEMAPGWWSD